MITKELNSLKRKGTILLVDDNPDNIELLQHSLKGTNHNVHHAYSGPDCLTLASDICPDLILLDIQMPGMSGYEVCRKLKSRPKTSHIPIIFVTAMYTDDTSIVKGLELGAHDFITKPFKPRELVARVNVMMRISQTEREIRHTRDYFHNILNNSGELILSTDIEGNVVLANDLSKQILNEDILNNKPFWNIAKDPYLLEMRFHEVISMGNPLYFDFIIIGQADKIYETECTISRLMDEDKNIIGSVVIIRDVTSKKKLEQTLMKNEKLSALGRMLAGVTHEVNNPLANIIGHSELLKKLNDLDKIKNSNDIIYKESMRARDIVQRLLKFSRIGNSKLTKVHINLLIQETMAVLNYNLKNKDIKIETDLCSNLPFIVGDPQQLQQVFINIITNAEQAMFISSVKNPVIKIKTITDVNGVHISIEDNGPGITDCNLDKIFDPFFTTKTESEGTGLGLSVSYGIIEKHNGHITAGNLPENGAVFHIILPTNIIK